MSDASSVASTADAGGLATYCAPGKVVISGAYSVLRGAPAIVAAVDRYVVASTARPAEFVADEWRAAQPGVSPPWFDASQLRHAGRKLGLGSSSAILVASLAAHFGRCEPAFVDETLFPMALRAHREAQGGGSGIDVAAACYGGIQCARQLADGLAHAPIALPGLHVEVWSSNAAASTSAFLERVRELEQRDSALHAGLLCHLSDAAEEAVETARQGDGARFIAALDRQFEGLASLGQAASIPIVTDAVAALHEIAARQAAIVIPSGAGGGDVALYVGSTPPARALLEALVLHGHERLRVSLNGQGVHACGHSISGPGAAP